jgi:hypothetical protein
MAGGGEHSWRSSSSTPPSTGTRGAEGSGGQPNADPCDIVFETILSPTDVAELQRISAGEVLKVETVFENQIERLGVKRGNVTVGVIANPRGAEVIACMKSGNQYIARVIDVRGNQCRVRVERK